MSDQPQQPYQEQPLGKDDVMAVASLLGQVSGSLKEIDKRNVGGNNHNIQASKMDPKRALETFVGTGGMQEVTNSPPPVLHNPPPVVPVPQHIPQPLPQQPEDNSNFEKRLLALERIVETFKAPVKFKRGISYTVSTSKMTAEFKDPSVIIDIISSELAKATKSITIKLNDKSKN